MVEWVWEFYGIGKVLEATDPRQCGDFDEQQMEYLIRAENFYTTRKNDINMTLKNK
jgi:hypothetical protein